MANEVILVHQMSAAGIDKTVIDYMERGYHLYGGPFNLQGGSAQIMAAGPLPTEALGQYKIVRKLSARPWQAEMALLEADGWLVFGNPYEQAGEGRQAMVKGNVLIKRTAGYEEDSESVSGGNETGFLNYQNSLGIQNLTGGSWTTILNNGQGAATQTLYAPKGVTSMLDSATGKIILSGLAIGDLVEMQHAFTTLAYTNNMDFVFRNFIGQAGQQYEMPLGQGYRMASGAGVSSALIGLTSRIFVRDENTRLGGILPQVKSNGTAEINYASVLITVTRKAN